MAIKTVFANVAAQGTYPTDPQLEFNVGAGITAINNSTTSTVFISLNGVDDHLQLIPGVIAAGVFQGKYAKAWARIAVVVGGPVVVQLVAEG